MSTTSAVEPRMQMDRVKALTDGVLAIVLTILVLSFEVPDREVTQAGLLAFLADLREPLIAYVVSFGITATYWVQHSAIFHYIHRASRPLVWLNLAFLLPVTLLPFLTDLRAEYHDVYISTAFYAGANMLSGLFLLLIWRHAVSSGLAPSPAPEVDRSMGRRILLGIGLNALGAAVAPINVYLSSAVFLTLPVIYLSHRVVDSHWADPAQAA